MPEPRTEPETAASIAAAPRGPRISQLASAIADSRSLPFAILLLALLVRVLSAHAHWTWFDTMFPSTWKTSRIELSQNGTEYVLQAQPDTWNAHLHAGWSDKAYFRPPLASYYFVGLFHLTGFNRLAVSAVQALVAVGGYLLVVLLAERLLNRRMAALAAVVLALHPVLIFEDTSFEDSCLGLLFVAAALWSALWARDGARGRWLVPGIAMGLTALSRPNLLTVGVGIAVLLWRWTPAQARAGALARFAGPVLGCVLLATLHNVAASKRWAVITDMAGQNLYWGNNPFPDHRLSVQGYWDIREVDSNNPGQLLVDGLKLRAGVDSTDAAFMAGAIDFVTAEPVRALAGLAHKAWRALSNYEIPRDRDFAWCRDANPFLQLPLLPYSLLFGFALLGARRLPRDGAFLLFLPCIAAFVTEVAFFNASRYRALAVPFLVPLAVSGAIELYRSAYDGRWRSAVPAAAFLAALLYAGEQAVPSSERSRHEAVAMYKAAMLESYADDDGNWAWLSRDRFQERLAAARRLDPSNLDAFFVEQKYLIHEGEFERVDRNVAARLASCRPGEWLCEEIGRTLRRLIAGDGATPRGNRSLRR